MITTVLSGLFRQGTTLVWWLAKLSNPNKLHLYEPCHEELFTKLERWERGKRDKMHGKPLWDDYLEIPEEHLEIMRKHHRDFRVTLDFEPVIPYLDAIERIPAEIVIQPNRWSMILADIKLRYQCETIQIVRNPVDTWIDHFTVDALKDENRFWKKSLEKTDNDPFFTDLIYNALAERYGFPKGIPLLEQFAVVWTLHNYFGIIGADVVINFDKLILDPERYLRRLNAKLKTIRFDPNYANEVMPSEYGKFPRYRRKIKRVIETTVYDFGLDKFYDKVIDTMNVS